MKTKEQKTDSGFVKIHKEAIANIALLAAKDTQGVLGTTAGGLIGRTLKFIGKEKIDQGIKVELQENSVRIKIGIVVEYGISIPDVATAVQDNVKRQVENMTGLSPVEVNVDVQRIDVKKLP